MELSTIRPLLAQAFKFFYSGDARKARAECDDFAFHMTDWLEDLEALVRLYQQAEQRSPEEAEKILVQFLVHAPGHINEASRLLLDYVSDPFGVFSTDEEPDGGDSPEASDEQAIEIDPLDKLYEQGKASDAMLYSALFWPELVEVEGSVLLKSRLAFEGGPEAFLQARSESDDMASVEARFNLLQVSSAFSDLDTSYEEVVVLAQRIAEAWRGRLLTGYPERRFQVELLNTEEEVDDDPEVRFFELRARHFGMPVG